jgi:hypothetical protein
MARPVVANNTETTPEPNAPAGGVTGKGFLPGESGNPLGRPKGIARYVRERAGSNGELMIDFLISAMAGMMPKGGYNSLDGEGRPILVEISPAERITAAKILVERGFGKAPAFAPIEDDDPLDLQSEQALEDLAGRMDEKIDELAARRKRRAPAKPRRAATA